MSAPRSGSERPWKGLDTSRMPVFLGYDQIERMVAALLERAAAWRPDAVAGIARGGIVPASMAAGILALPLSFLRHDTASGAVDWIGPPPDGQRILLVDDCCSSGTTLRRTRDALRAEGRDCLTLVVVHDPETIQHAPDLSHPMRELFRLPWERGEATPTGRAAKARGDRSDPRAEAPFVGVALDDALLARLVSGDAGCPRFPFDRTVFISDIADTERGRIELSLAATRYRGIPLHLRPAGSAPGAGYAAAAATRLGCTHFIACDAARAIEIAAQARHLIVTWWSVAEGRGWVIGAAPAVGAG